MATPGYTDLPSTEHFKFEFKNELNADRAKALGKALADTVERDFASIADWFGGATPKGGLILTKINLAAGGASNDFLNNINLRLGDTQNFDLARAVLVAELMEIFMAVDPAGWNPGDSSGEGLSLLGALTIYPGQRGVWNGPQVWLDTSVGASAGNPGRPDFVDRTEATDANAVSFGCALLFLYFLRAQLGFSMSAVINAHAETLEGVYRKLTQDTGGFGILSSLLERRFPSGRPSGLAGSADPFPLPGNSRLSVKRFMAKKGLSPTLIGHVMKANVRQGNLRALLNSDRPASLL